MFESILLHFYCQRSPWNASLAFLAIKKKPKKKNGVNHGWRQTGWAKRSEHGGRASFLYSPQQTPQKICFDGATFCRKPAGLIATHCLKTLYLWRFQPTASPAVTQPSASISKKRTATQMEKKNKPQHLVPKFGEATLCCAFHFKKQQRQERRPLSSGWSVSLCPIFQSVAFTNLLYLASPAFCRNVNLGISRWATAALFFSSVYKERRRRRLFKKKRWNTTKIHGKKIVSAVPLWATRDIISDWRTHRGPFPHKDDHKSSILLQGEGEVQAFKLCNKEERTKRLPEKFCRQGDLAVRKLKGRHRVVGDARHKSLNFCQWRSSVVHVIVVTSSVIHRGGKRGNRYPGPAQLR